MKGFIGVKCMDDKGQKPPDLDDLLRVIVYLWRCSAPFRVGISMIGIAIYSLSTPLAGEGGGEMMALLLIAFVIMILFTTPWS